MDCIQPGTIAPEDLLAFLDGEAPPAVGEHLRRCPGCAARARAYARSQDRLRAALRRIDCPSPLVLGEYELRLLAPEEGRRIAAHLGDCPRCAAEIGQLRGFLAAEPAPTAPGPVERVRRLVATLVAAPPRGAYAGLRGADDDDTRTYRAGDLTLSLSTGPSARRGRLSLDGLLWREGGGAVTADGGSAILSAAGGATETAEIDDLGNFAFDEVAPGTYGLEVALGDEHIVVEGVVLAR